MFGVSILFLITSFIPSPSPGDLLCTVKNLPYHCDPKPAMTIHGYHDDCYYDDDCGDDDDGDGESYCFIGCDNVIVIPSLPLPGK